MASLCSVLVSDFYPAGVTWGSQSWETYSGFVNGIETFEDLHSVGSVKLEASSAVLVYL